jgi:hypothetical protein
MMRAGRLRQSAKQSKEEHSSLPPKSQNAELNGEIPLYLIDHGKFTIFGSKTVIRE